MRTLWIPALLALLGGCLDLKSNYPERRFFALEAARRAPERTAPEGTVLRVRRFTASQGCEGSELVSRTADAAYETDFYNAFFVPPATQMTEQTARWLGSAGLFSHVVGSGSTLPETHVLEGHLVALHVDARDRRALRGVLELQLLLVRVSVDPPRVTFEKTYRREIPLSKEDPESSVRGWNEGLSSILADFEADLAKADRNPR